MLVTLGSFFLPSLGSGTETFVVAEGRRGLVVCSLGAALSRPLIRLGVAAIRLQQLVHRLDQAVHVRMEIAGTVHRCGLAEGEIAQTLGKIRWCR
jgi:hypothetical protein